MKIQIYQDDSYDFMVVENYGVEVEVSDELHQRIVKAFEEYHAVQGILDELYSQKVLDKKFWEKFNR